jgi:hypothetical protein
MEGFKQNGPVGLIQFGQVEEDFGFSRIGYRRLLKQDMFPGADSSNGPFEVKAIG